MSDSLEPPAKRARLEADAPFYGASSLENAPGSPVDDDDDFYDTAPVEPARWHYHCCRTGAFGVAHSDRASSSGQLSSTRTRAPRPSRH